MAVMLNGTLAAVSLRRVAVTVTVSGAAEVRLVSCAVAVLVDVSCVGAVCAWAALANIKSAAAAATGVGRRAVVDGMVGAPGETKMGLGHGL